MCPPGRSRWVTSSLETRSSSGRCPRGRDVVRARGDHEQVLLDPSQVDALAAQPQATGDEPVLLVHPGDPLAVGPSGERRVVGHPLGHRLVRHPRSRAVEDALKEPAVGGGVVRHRLHHLVRHVDAGARGRRDSCRRPGRRRNRRRRPRRVERVARVDRRRQQRRVAHRPGRCSAQYIAHSVPPIHQPSERELLRAGCPQRLAHRPVQLVADELRKPHVAVLVIRDPPIERGTRQIPPEQVLDERVAGRAGRRSPAG